MIITLKGATASKNLGGLNFYSILVNKSSGVTVTLDKTTVDKATASSTTVTGTVTVADDYTLSSVVITMGGTDVTSSCYDSSTGAITITGITGNVVVKATATSNSGSGDSGGTETTNYTLTINPIPTDATVTLNGVVQKTITVNEDATVAWSVTKTGYTPQNGTWVANKDETKTITLAAISDGESYWISEKLTGKTVGSGTPSSLLGSQLFVIRDTDYIAELTGKTVESVAIGFTNKAVTNGRLKIYLVDLNNEAPANWVLKDTITGWAGEASTVHIKDLNTPFVVPSGYTIGYSGGDLLGAGTVTEGYSRDDYYYANASATSATKITMASFDVKVKS